MTTFSSRFRRDAGRTRAIECRGDVLSDSSDGGSPLGGSVRRIRPEMRTRGSLNENALEFLQEDGARDRRSAIAMGNNSIQSEYSNTETKKLMMKNKQTRTTQSTMLERPKQKTLDTPSRSHSSWTQTTNMRKKWYYDSDEEEEEEEMGVKDKVVQSHVTSERDEGRGCLDLDSCGVDLMMKLPERTCEQTASMPIAIESRFAFNRMTDRKGSERTGERVSDESGSVALSLNLRAECDPANKTPNMLRLLTKTRTMSISSGNGNDSGCGTPRSSSIRTVAAGKLQRDTASASEHSMADTSPFSNAGIRRPAKVETRGNGLTPMVLINRRTDQLKHSASGSEYSGSPRFAISSNDDVVSPGLRKVPGALPGKPGSGVLLEGWLRQEQRRGMKGPKKWSLRYFVLYARSNEVRYYADVVQSAWGPIPLGEIGSISLRLIQRIGKLSHPKYKGCRFDITCRNSSGAQYTDDDDSSDEENASSNNTASAHSDTEKTGTPAAKQEKGGTPRSSRVYSFVADSPQVTLAWVNVLDSLLTRSANSPRPDVSSPAKATSGTPTTHVPRALARQRSCALDTETCVVLGPGECVPKAVIYAMNFIFDSTPGIETEMFYEVEPDASKLKAALKFLNEFAGEAVTRKPTMEELENLLDAFTASAIVRLWLQQLEQPLIPFAMYDDFKSLADEAPTAPRDRSQKLRALLHALPPNNLTMLACLLFHLNDVNVYSSKNGMNAAQLASYFTDSIVRSSNSSHIDRVDSAVKDLIEKMITNVDTFMDEQEAQVLEANRV